MPTFTAELRFQRQGYKLVAGLDEVGRGAWAGPLLAGAVILPEPTRTLRRTLAAVNDSMQLSAAQREVCAEVIRTHALACGVGQVSVYELDAWGMTRATHEAMRRALAALALQPQALLIDAFPLPSSPLPQRAIVRGDSYSFSIAAASIIAKVTRDALMRALHETEPPYGFCANKGYGTRVHQAALQQFGPSPQHRRLFAPVRRSINEETGS